MTDGHLDFTTVLSLQQTLDKPTVSIRDPVGLLGIVGLGHVFPLHLEGEEEVGGGVRVLPVRGPFLLVSGHAGGVESSPTLTRAELKQTLSTLSQSLKYPRIVLSRPGGAGGSHLEADRPF